MKKIILYKEGYEPYIDFIKGYMMLCILFTHACSSWKDMENYSLYHLWGCVPTGSFMLVSSLHQYKKMLTGSDLWIIKPIVRVLVPFIIWQLLLLLCLSLFVRDHIPKVQLD